MKNSFAIAIVVILAVGLGVILTYQQTSSPLMREFVKQQKEILVGQKRIEKQLSAAGSSEGVARLERKIDTLARGMRNAPSAPRPSAPRPPSDEYAKVYNIPVGDSHIRGKKDAPITIVEFADFQCPFCSRFHPVLDEVLKAYPNQVRYVIKNFPLSFHQQSHPAAKAALAAGEQGKYWEMAEGLLANFQSLSAQKIDEIAKDIGLNVDKFHQDLKKNDANYEKILADDIALGRKVDVRGTPTFYINGRKTTARTLPAYKAEIDTILKKK